MPPLDVISQLVQDVVDAVERVGKDAREAREAERRRLLELARHAGLEGPQWKSGRVQGTLFGASIQWYQSSVDSGGGRHHQTHFLARFWPPLPSRLRVRTPNVLDRVGHFFDGASLDGPLLMAGNEVVRRLITPPVQRGLTAMGQVGSVRLESGVLRASRPGRMVAHGAALAEAVQVCAELVAGWQVRHQELEALGLSGTDRPGFWVGEVEGVRLEVFEARKRSRYSCFVRAPLLRPLPPETRVIRGRKNRPPPRSARPLGDMILDPLLVASSSDMPALSARLSRPVVHGPLLEIVHGHPGSRLTETHIELRRRGPVLGTCDVPLVVELHRALHP